MELRLLGPPELVVDGQVIDLGGPRQRLVLTLLALNANRVTPVEHLLDAVWDDDPPSTARGQIQICISALRKVFAGAGSAAIRTQAPGYVLAVAPDELDIDVFHARVAAGYEHAASNRPAEAVAELRAALALWRGKALAGIPGAAARREATRLHERKAAVLEERLRLDLALGRHQELIGELRALVGEQPLQERLHAFLMLALYRCGRQADALEAGRRARAVLAEEIGVDPGPELAGMEQAILTRSPSLNLPRETAPAGAEPTTGSAAGSTSGSASPNPGDDIAVPRQLPPSMADFTGRTSQLAEVHDVLLGHRDPYAVPIVSVSGPGGVGKSSMAIRAAHELVKEFPDGQLYADMRANGVDDGASRQLARFLRALGVPGTSVPEDLQERAELYRSKLADRRLLIVLDDVADEEQALPLLPGNPRCAVITTSRTRLTGLPGAYCVDVDTLDPAQSMALLSRIIGPERIAAEPEAADRLVELCAGLPLALRIAGARLASRPHWRVEDLARRLDDESRRLDEFVHKGLELRSTIALTYRGLPERARRLFRLCALVDAVDFPGWAPAALLDTSLREAEDLLETLVDAHVLEVRVVPGEQSHRYRFHGLVRVFDQERLTEEETPEARAAAVERYLGGWLALSDAAHRREYGGDYTVLHSDAPRWFPPDADLPEPVGDPLAWWERERRGLVPAIRQAAAAGLADACWDLTLTSVTLFETRGYGDDWVETATLAAAVTVGDPRGQAAARYALGALAMAQKRLSDAEEHFDAALAGFSECGDVHGRGLVLRNAAFISRLRGETGNALTRYTEALEHMRLVGDRVGEAHVLASLAKLRIDDGDTTAARSMLDEAVAICRTAGCLRVEAQVTYRLAELHLGLDDIAAARHALHRTLRVVRDLGDQVGETYALYALGKVRHREGRLDAAHTTLTHALSLADEVGDRWVEGQALFSLGEVTVARGNDAAGAEHLRLAADRFHELGLSVWQAKSLVLLAEVHLSAGEETAASDCLDSAHALLADVDSEEARRWTTQTEHLRAALMSANLSPS
ncbi:AfsR/SARP family transcriptional regulator [Saccharothrix sp. NRRL B-16314]|uniref:AfsR/SARP family transcriptional regulator n=1 Tax=Saccharothrix sp. NRRL B-16314 TaxID=1463825 RepID=UPI000690BA5B|nr:BTAD domain-containing putative transcriptional regulator [Saccharothrix sp. NRRL B-16314]